MKISKNKGFTLIELLVVISIIALLSSVVLASLNSARSRGSDAAVKAAFKQLAAQGALYVNDFGLGNGSFGGTVDTGITASCTTGFLASGQQGANILTNINANDNGTPTCYIGRTVWAVSVPLKGGGNWCTDHTGRVGNFTAGTSGTCN